MISPWFMNRGMNAAKDSLKRNVAVQHKPLKMYTGLDIEMEFLNGYKKFTGQDAFPQYVDIEDPDGQKRKVLGYQLHDGTQYIPQLHGATRLFRSRDLLNQIPTYNDVAFNRFTPFNPHAIAKATGSAVPMASGAPQAPDVNELRGRMTNPEFGSALAMGQTPVGDPMVPKVPDVQESPRAHLPPMPAQPEPGPELPLDQRLLAAIQKQTTIDPRFAQAGQIRQDAAGMQRDVLSPNVTLQSALPLILATILGGEQGGEILRGGVAGIQQATGLRQARSDESFRAKQAGMLANAAALEGDATRAEQAQDAEVRGLNAALTLEDRRKLNDERNQIAADRVRATLRGQDMKQIGELAKMGPEGRRLWAKQNGYSDTEAGFLAGLKPDEVQKLASAEVSKEKAQSERTLRPYRQELMDSQTDLNRTMATFQDLRKDGQSIKNQIDTKELEGWDDKRSAELRNLEARTDKAMADAYAARTALFHSDGTPRTGGGMTASTFTTQWSKFQTAFDAADAEIVQKSELAAKLRSRISSLESQAKADKAKNPMFPNTDIEKELTKKANQLEILESEIAGLSTLRNSAKRDLDTLKSLPGGNIGGGQPSALPPNQGLDARTQGALDTYNDKSVFSKLKPEQQKVIVNYLKGKGLIK